MAVLRPQHEQHREQWRGCSFTIGTDAVQNLPLARRSFLGGYAYMIVCEHLDWVVDARDTGDRRV